ncbi:Chitin-binding type 1 protein [Lasiodiplodia theobromae]|uniref:Chitin-binding type 1 protein n=1 Tax=Lasiodiplodia theobromae TaxID=45133 RepID=UPI0015C2EC96|nr:Chitin-binding type 1 protein [Lasiodiplodia theobromae]KAF4538871.1 Chitin-binding type 1 protein [Lasiodiplodia theobromae]
MARISSLRLSLGAALLLANVCYAQDSASPPGDSAAPADASASAEPTMSIFADPGSPDAGAAEPAAAATTTDDGASGVATTMDVGAGPPTPTFPYPPGSYPIGDTTYYVACETGDMNTEWSPSLIVQGSANIDDYGTCMAFCESLGKVLCVTAMWNPESSSPCQILQSYQNLLSQPFGRCYGARPYVPGDDQPSPPTGGFPPDSPSDPDFPVPPTTSDTSGGPPVAPGPPGAPPGQSDPLTSSVSSPQSPSRKGNPNGSSAAPPHPQPLRRDAKCGSEWGSIPYTSCPQDHSVYGPCCSRFGYCGRGHAQSRKHSSGYYPSDPSNPGYYPSTPGYSQSAPDYYPSDPDYYPSNPGYSPSGPDYHPSDRGYYPSDHGSSPSDYDNDRIPPYVTSPQDHGGRRPKGKRPHKCKQCEEKKEKGY